MANIIDAIKSLVPNPQFTMVGNSYDGINWLDTRPQPTEAQVNAEILRLDEQEPLNACKEQASKLLYETDWTTIPDVADPANSPYLKNQAEFIAWRSLIRALAVNPVSNPVFPPKPNEVWG